MAKVERICKHCGKVFEIEASRLKHGRGQTCSPACQYASIRRRVTVTCAQCGKPFEVRQADYDYRCSIGEPPTYCSHRCAHDSPAWKANLGQSLRESEPAQQAQARGVAAMNANIGTADDRARRRRQTLAQMANPEQRAAWEASIQRRTQSPEWRGAAHFQRGVNHPRYTGSRAIRQVERARYAYKSWRSFVFERDNFTCQECGVRGGRLHAHHVKPWATHAELRYETANGVTLCESCHRLIPRPYWTGQTHRHTSDT